MTTYIILILGVLITLASVVLICRPSYIFSLFDKYGDSIGLHLFAIAVRIVFGIALVVGASETRFPIVLEVFGWVTIVAALVLVVIGREKFKNLIKWSVALSPMVRRFVAVLGVMFGCFIVYAVV